MMKGAWGTGRLALFLVVAAPSLTQAQWSYQTNNGAITLAAYAGLSPAVTVPDMIDGLPVTSIGEFAFAGSVTLVRATIGSSVTNVGPQAFGLCQSLNGVYFQGNAPSPSSDLSVFSGDYSATAYYLAGTTGWGSTFDGLPAVAINAQFPFICTTNPHGVTITAYTGSGSRVTVPRTIGGLPVTAIGSYAFEGCDTLASVTIPASVTNLGSGAFVFCSGLTNVTIPHSVASIGAEAFEDCISLTNITIPNSVASIGYAAFYCCTSLKTVTIPSSVTNVAPFAFQFCTGLKAAYFQGNAPAGDSTVFSFDQATAHYLPGATGWGPAFGGLPTAPWALPYPLILNPSNGPNLGGQANGFGFTISWATNGSVVVEAAESLVDPVWTPVATNTLAAGVSAFNDPQWTNYAARFYRISFPEGGRNRSAPKTPMRTGLPGGQFQD